MGIFSNDFTTIFFNMIKEALKKAVKEVVSEICDEEKFLLNRKEIASAIGCDVDTFDSEYRHLPGFPYHKKGSMEAWNKKEVFDYLHKHKLLK